MDIQVNGDNQTVQEGLTVTDLLRQLEIRPEQVAVELNLKILDRQDFSSSILHQGDTVEILSFIGGGADAGPFYNNALSSSPRTHHIG